MVDVFYQESILKTSDPWDVSSSDIILFDPAPAKVHKDEDNLLSSYPSPKPSTFKMAPCVTEANLTKENYKDCVGLVPIDRYLATYLKRNRFLPPRNSKSICSKNTVSIFPFI